MLEHQRRGNFVRIYPTKNSDYYDCFLGGNRHNQQMLYYYLYTDVFPSFKDVRNCKPIFGEKHLDKQKRVEDKRLICRELLLEYLVRILNCARKIDLTDEIKTKTGLLLDSDLLVCSNDPDQELDFIPRLINKIQLLKEENSSSSLKTLGKYKTELLIDNLNTYLPTEMQDLLKL